MKELKHFAKVAWGIYGPFFPVSRRKRQDFIDNVRQKVDFYKPMIEERCKVDLGEVKVKDNKEWSSDVMYYSAYQTAFENASRQGRAPMGIDYNISFVMASIARGILAYPFWIYNNIYGADFRQHDGTIYVPFYYTNMSMDMDLKKRTKRIDYGVVHELSHILWDAISGDSEGGFGERRRWFEGFATYCAENFFADFYPEGTPRIFNLPQVYTEGKRKVEELISKNGKDIVLEIPRRWNEFSKSE